MHAQNIDTGRLLTAEELRSHGIYHRVLPLDEAVYQPELEELKQKHGYIEQDIVELRPDTPDLDVICAKFDGEHLHVEDEVRFVLEGEGVFEIRSDDDCWLRVTVERGDLIVVPARRYHRFELTDSQTIRCVRLFKDKSGWVPHYRDA